MRMGPWSRDDPKVTELRKTSLPFFAFEYSPVVRYQYL
jgi:hypothetical protein